MYLPDIFQRLRINGIFNPDEQRAEQNYQNMFNQNYPTYGSNANPFSGNNFDNNNLMSQQLTQRLGQMGLPHNEQEQYEEQDSGFDWGQLLGAAVGAVKGKMSNNDNKASMDTGGSGGFFGSIYGGSKQSNPRDSYNPSSKYADLYGDLLGQEPQREKSGMLRKIIAAIASGAAGWNDNSQIPQMYDYATGGKKYGEEYSKWQKRVGMYEKAADNERQTNTSERIYDDQRRDREVAQQRADIQARRAEIAQELADAKIANDAKRTEIAAARAKVYEFKANNPGYKFVTSKGGNVFAVNPLNPGEKPIDTGIPSGTLDEMDKITLGIDAAIKVDNARTANDRILQGDRQEDTLEAIEKREGLIRGRPPKPTGSGAISPTQESAARRLKANEYMINNPKLAKYIHINGTNVTIDPPSKWGLTQAQYDTIKGAILGSADVKKNELVGNKPTTVTREMAVKALQDNKIPVTPENIAKAMNPANWK